jgi:hypothetical protein
VIVVFVVSKQTPVFSVDLVNFSRDDCANTPKREERKKKKDGIAAEDCRVMLLVSHFVCLDGISWPVRKSDAFQDV